VARLLRSGDHDRLTLEVGRKLASGWVRYGVWETAVAAGLVLLPWPPGRECAACRPAAPSSCWPAASPW
jgi:hypothetical protein